MKKTLLLIHILFIVGCTTTQSFRKVSESEVPKYTDVISNNEMGVYSSYWVQPGNKIEKCELLMEGYDFGNKIGNDIKSESLTWDGECKSGKTHGLGKMLVNQGSIDWYEIAFHNQGITDEYYFRTVVGSKEVDFGAYIRENNKNTKLLVNKANLKDDGSLGEIYILAEEDSKHNIHRGLFTKNYNNGYAKLSGALGSNLFFGKRDIYNKDDQLDFTNFGFYDLTNDKPSLFFIHKDKQRVQHVKINDDNTNEFIQLPTSFINDVQKVPEDALKIARVVSRAGEMALIMKKKYENNYNISGNEEVQKEPRISNTVSTGTGFFISNDGVLLTNSHVVENSSKVSVIFHSNRVEATVLAKDTINDIALLKISKSTTAIPLEVNNKTKKGSEISILGYPNIGLQGNEQKATFGYINSNSGVKGDSRFYQMSAPIQAGNSGSPVLNNSGSVVGIATSTLNQSAAIKSTGNLAQNVNYAIKITYALPLLISNNVKYNKSKSYKINKTNLIDKISDSVVLVVAE